MEKDWGIIEDGVFVKLPKNPMQNTGYKTPPFDITMHDGSIRHIIEAPDDNQTD